MAEKHVEIIRKRLRDYAHRGVLREFSEKQNRGKTEFNFTWLLDQSFTLVVDDKAGKLIMKNMLPHVPARSRMYDDIKTFVEGRTSKKLPAHRRITSGRAELACNNRNSVVSFTLTVKRNQYDYALTRIMGFVNELFGRLDMYHTEYLWEHFEVPAE